MARELTPIYEAIRPNVTVYEQQLRQYLVVEKLELQRLLLAKSVKIQKIIEPLVFALWKASTDELITKLRDENPLVRWFSADILSRRQVHVEKQLIRLLEDPYQEVRGAARQALVRLARGTDFGPNVAGSRQKIAESARRWEAWLDEQDAKSAARTGSLAEKLRSSDKRK